MVARALIAGALTVSASQSMLDRSSAPYVMIVRPVGSQLNQPYDQFHSGVWVSLPSVISEEAVALTI